MRNIILEENQLRRVFSDMLRESEWNFHFGNDHDMKPYRSDNRYRMLGRETGHFGSGTYFSTYKGSDSVKDYGDSNPNKNPNFIKIGGSVYRVDFSIYKNLYRVRSKEQGDLLYTMMRNLNGFFNRVNFMGDFVPKEANYDNATRYQIIRQNAEALGLKCPSYYELTRMAQNHGKDKEAIQSFSTLFMEWNGFNGVNVSGVEYYDNTKHGSVIYDLSKTDTEMEEISPVNLYTGSRNSAYDDTIASNGFNDYTERSIRGDDLFWTDELNNMKLPKALRLLKNYTDSGKILEPYQIKKMNDELAKRYLRLIYVKRPKGYWSDPIEDDMFGYKNCDRYIDLIDKYKAYYWVNYQCKGKWKSVLVKLLSNFSSNAMWEDNTEELKKQYLDNLLSYMTRELTPYEKEYIEEDYFEN